MSSLLSFLGHSVHTAFSSTSKHWVSLWATWATVGVVVITVSNAVVLLVVLQVTSSWLVDSLLLVAFSVDISQVDSSGSWARAVFVGWVGLAGVSAWVDFLAPVLSAAADGLGSGSKSLLAIAVGVGWSSGGHIGSAGLAYIFVTGLADITTLVLVLSVDNLSVIGVSEIVSLLGTDAIGLALALSSLLVTGSDLGGELSGCETLGGELAVRLGWAVSVLGGAAAVIGSLSGGGHRGTGVWFITGTLLHGRLGFAHGASSVGLWSGNAVVSNSARSHLLHLHVGSTGTHTVCGGGLH